MNKSFKQHPIKQQLYDHLPPISITIQIRRARQAGQVLETEDKINKKRASLNTFTRTSVGRLAKTYLQHLCADPGCSLEDLPKAMDDRDEWRERIKEICSRGMTW